jgi:hypothetical protein
LHGRIPMRLEQVTEIAELIGLLVIGTASRWRRVI